MIEYAEGQTFKLIELAQLVLQVKIDIDIDNATLYVPSGHDTIEQESIFQLGAYPEISDSDEEIFPEFVAANDLEVLYYGQQFVDVVRMPSCSSARLRIRTSSRP